MSWPKASKADQQIACSYCDCLQSAPLIEVGTSAHCLNCDQVLYQHRRSSLQRTAAFALAGLALLGVVFAFPFLQLDSSGLKSSMSILSTVSSLWMGQRPVIAIGVALFIIILPSFILLGLVYVVIPLNLGRVFPGAERVLRMVCAVEKWVMVEVFLLGTLVSLLKLGKSFQVHLGQGFWALVFLVILLAAIYSSLSRAELWDRIEYEREKMKG